ncbi:MAG: zinc ribbon domain-containing protein [Lachnospiraceae bacterium]|nr:zinc ribbon domain-containing protein [Lachnospiraceae bacterium]
MSAKEKRCAVCGNLISKQAEYCPYCGNQSQSSSAKICPGCGQHISENTMICPDCGYVIGKNSSKRKRKSVAFIIVFLLCVIVGVVILLHQQGVTTETLVDNTSQLKTDSKADKQLADKQEISLADADALFEHGKELISDDTGLAEGMNNLAGAIKMYMEKAEQAGDIHFVSEKVIDAYELYISASQRHKDMLTGQEVSGDIYRQIVMEYDDAIALGESLLAKGCEIDVSSVREEKEVFETGYKERVINLFNQFTEREMWSRTEAWNLMASTVDNMFDSSDLDNPLRLRYAYALSWWIQKEIETESANGMTTKKAAAMAIAESIEAMDYNLMMLNYYITYMKDVGEDCSQVETAYHDVIEHIYHTQGILIGKDFDLEHFWYFNDFDSYSVDDRNGVTKENRQWIRSRMSQVIFETR